MVPLIHASILSKVHESEQVNELLTKRLEAERAEKQRLNDAIATTQVFVMSPTLPRSKTTLYTASTRSQDIRFA